MILDATCGCKGIYHGNDENFTETELIFMDKRLGTFKGHPRQTRMTETIHIHPTTVASLTKLPFRDNLFTLIIYDPPWMNISDTSWFHFRYDGWDRHTYALTTHHANNEFHRVLKPYCPLITKYQTPPKTAVSTLQDYIDKMSNFSLLLELTRSSHAGQSNAPVYWLVFVAK